MAPTHCHNDAPWPMLLPAALWMLSALGQATVARAEPYTAQAMWQLARLAEPAISPDGRLAVVSVTRYDTDKNQGVADLWLIPTKPGKARQLTSDAAAESSAAFSPDGTQIAFVSKRGDDKEPQVYVIAVDGGEARRITQVPTGVSAPQWFPDSRRIAFLSQVWPEAKDWEEMARRMQERAEPRVSAKVWDQAPITYWDHFVEPRELHLYVVEVDGGEPRPLTPGTGVALDAHQAGSAWYDIAPDGTEIALVGNSDRSGIEPNLDIFLLSLEGERVPRNITLDNSAHDTAPQYSPDGRLLAFRRQMIADFYADRARLMLFERRSGKLRNLTEQWDRSADALVWSPDSQALFGAIEDAGTRRIYRFDISGAPPRAITGEHSFGSLAVAGSGPVILALRESFTEPPTLVSIIGRTGSAIKLSDFNDAALARLSPGRVESLTYAGAQDEAVQMWVVYPPDFTPQRQWPVYLLLHGGPHNGVSDAYHWRWNAQVFASWGYVTAWHNFHGSSGFGQAWADAITREWGELPYQDTVKAADWFAQQPWVDRERMAAGGGSYGGYLATLLLGRAHPFKTLIAHAPVYNSYTQYGADEGAIRKRHGEHWEDLERFQRNSPHMSAARFNTPMLIFHGQLDQRVPVTQAFELFNTLQNRGVPSRLVYFPDEHHWVLKPRNSLFWYQTQRQWLERYVTPGPGAAAAVQASP